MPEEHRGSARSLCALPPIDFLDVRILDSSKHTSLRFLTFLTFLRDLKIAVMLLHE